MQEGISRRKKTKIEKNRTSLENWSVGSMYLQFPQFLLQAALKKHL